MGKPDYPEIFSAGDCAALTISKIGGIAHQGAGIVGRQVAFEMGRMDIEEANQPLLPVVFSIGDVCEGEAFYVGSTLGSVATMSPQYRPNSLSVED